MTDVRSVALLSVELWEHMVERTGLEPVTLRLSDENSNQLNYLSTDSFGAPPETRTRHARIKSAVLFLMS